MTPEAWIADLDDLDLLIADIGSGATLAIRKFEIDFYRRSGATFRPITDRERETYERQINQFADSIKRDRETRWALT